MNGNETTNETSRADPPENHTEDTDKWWVSKGKMAEGPYSAAYIATILNARQIAPTTLVCRVGSAEWRPLDQCASLAETVKNQSPGMLPPPLPDSLRPSLQKTGLLRPFTNPQLPSWANWICVYCILIAPACLGVFYLFTFATGTSCSAGLRAGSPLLGYGIAFDVIALLADVAIASMLVWGGLLLKNLQRKGAVLVQVGLLLSFCWGLVDLLTWVLWDAIVTLAGEARPLPAETTPGELIGFVLLVPLLLLAVAMLVFEVLALIWLFKNARRLPLEESVTLPPPISGP